MPPPLSTLRAPLVYPGMKIGLFGGSFDPPHAGHAHVAQTALKRLGLDQVWWLVSPQNPLKPRSGSFETRRAAVLRLAPGGRHRVSDLEHQLGIQYTAQLVNSLLRRYPGVTFVWLMGADNLAGFDRWRSWKSIFSRVRVAVIARPGAELKSLGGKTAQVFRFARIPENAAGTLVRRPPPAWVYLNARLNPLSSTHLRTGR